MNKRYYITQKKLKAASAMIEKMFADLTPQTDIAGNIVLVEQDGIRLALSGDFVKAWPQYLCHSFSSKQIYKPTTDGITELVVRELLAKPS